MSTPSWSVVVVAKCLISLPSRFASRFPSWSVVVMCKPLKNLPSRFRRGRRGSPPHTPYTLRAPLGTGAGVTGKGQRHAPAAAPFPSGYCPVAGAEIRLQRTLTPLVNAVSSMGYGPMYASLSHRGLELEASN